MSGLEGGSAIPAAVDGVQPAAGAPAPGGFVNVSASKQPAKARSHQEMSDDLDQRIQAKKLAAERADRGLPPKQVESKQVPRPVALGRAPDGKFLPSNTSKAASGAGVDVSPDDEAGVHDAALETNPAAAQAAPKATEKPVTEHPEYVQLAERTKGLEDRDTEWTTVAERAMARLDSQEQYIKRLESALQQRGGQVDPTQLENMQLRERVRAIEMAEERAKHAAEQARLDGIEAQRAAYRKQFTDDTRAALTKYPHLLKDGPVLKEYLQLVYRGGDPTALAEVYAQRAAKRAGPQVTSAMAPRTLAGRGAGSGGPKLTDPRDIADKWKRQLGASA